MLLTQFVISLILFLTGVFGILAQRKNIIIILMCLELILLGVNLNFILFSLYLDDVTGQIWSIFILTVAAAEAAIGLAVLILYYRQRNNIYITEKNLLKY